MSARSVVAAMTARLAADADVAGFSEPLPGGMTQLRSLAFPVSNDLNALWVPYGASQADLDDAVAHRPARVTAPDPAPDVAAPAGWELDDQRIMVFEGEAPAWPEAVLEVAPHDLHAARGVVWRGLVDDDETAERLARMQLALGAHDSAHSLAVVEAGEPVAWCMVIAGAIDDVWTQPSHRRRGLARLVTRAALAAGGWHLAVDLDDDAALALYESEGFVQRGRLVTLSPAG